MMRMRAQKIFTSAHLVFVIRSYGDKTFFFATFDSDEHCCMDATVMLLYVELPYLTLPYLYFYLVSGYVCM